MKKHRVLTALLGVSLATVLCVRPIQAEQTFADFEDVLFKELMESDYTTMHFGVRDYAKYGIEKPEVNIGELCWDDFEENVKEDTEDLKTLHSFSYDALTDQEKVDYRTLEFYLENDKQRNAYPYFSWAFDNSDGMFGSLLTTLTEFVFYEKEDIDDYLKVLASLPDFLDECMDVTKKQAEKGYFLTDSMLSETEDAIDKFVSKTDDNELIKTFDDNIETFDGLSEDEKATYKKSNRDLVLNTCIPAYQKVGEELLKLKGTRQGEYNVSSLKDGKEYYQVLAQYKTSIQADVETILDLCTQYMHQMISESMSVMQSGNASSSELSFDSPEDVLSYLENHLDDLPQLDKVNYSVQYLDPSVANDSIVAYYLNPPVDEKNNNVIKINGENVSDTLDLYTTLAHEGFPGHLYQRNYYAQQNPAPIRTQINLMGYQEGWGMYAEGLALESSSLDADSALYQKLNIELSYVLDAAADLGVNGLDWGTKELSSYLENLGFDSSMAKDLYDFVTSRPGVILPYGVGVTVFELLRNKAEKALGNAFDLKEFNKVLLDGGDRPFEVVEDDVNAYCGIKDTDENNIFSHSHNQTKEKSKEQSGDEFPWLMYGVGGIAIVAIGGSALVTVIKNRKRDPLA